MFSQKHVEQAEALKGVDKARLLSDGQVLRVVFDHASPTGTVQAVERKLSLKSGTLGGTGKQKAQAEYRGFE